MKKKKLLMKMLAGVFSLSMVMSVFPANVIKAADTDTVSDEDVKEYSVTLDGNDIKASNVNGLTYKGFGFLSANSTSDLLLDYKSEHPEKYAEIMRYLFGGKYPIMNHIKIEMGNDRNNSSGSESASMRSESEEPNVKRNPGWQIAADAKKINPDITVSVLDWAMPSWVKTNEQKYQWFKKTILKAYEDYGFMVDYVNPNTNETWKTADVARTKNFKKWVSEETKETIPDDKERELFQKIRFIVSDEANTVSEEVGTKLKEDQEFNDAVSVVGYHYVPLDDDNGSMKWFAEEQDKEVWASENQAVFSDTDFRPNNGTGIGGTGSGLEMMNSVVAGFKNARRTLEIYQPAVASMYEGDQYSFKELVSARDPWSGWVHYDAGLLMLAHLSKFAVTGWENSTNTKGIWRGVQEASESTAYINGKTDHNISGADGGQNYLTLAAPDKTDFSTVIVNDSKYTQRYTLNVKNMSLKNDEIEVWETRAADDGAFNENYMKCLGNAEKNADGSYSVTVRPYSLITLTSLDVDSDEEHTQGIPVDGKRTVLDTDETGAVHDTSNDVLYADDFEYKDKKVTELDGNGYPDDENTSDYISSRGGDSSFMPRYINNIDGIFEGVKKGDGHVLRQQIQKGENYTNAWNAGLSGNDAFAVLGDFRWMNYSVSVDTCVETDTTYKERDTYLKKTVERKPYSAVSVREMGNGSSIFKASGYTFRVRIDGSWDLFRKNTAVANGNVTEDDGFKSGTGQWNRLTLSADGAVIKAYINGKEVVQYTDPDPIRYGRIGLGSSFNYTDFDNLKVSKIKGTVPYLSEYIDNMETYDLTEMKTPKLVYEGTWKHEDNQGMAVFQRSISTGNKGDTLSYTFNGTGFQINGKQGKDPAKIKVTVDGETVSEGTAVSSSGEFLTAYQYDGLKYGTHTFKVEITDGTLYVDTVGILGGADAEDGENGNDIPPENTFIPVSEEPSALPSDTPSAVPSEVPSESTAGNLTAVPSAAPSSSDQKDTRNAEAEEMSGRVITFKKAVYRLSVKDGKNTASLVKTASEKIGSFTVPAAVRTEGISFTVNRIGANAFKKCGSLRNITIGRGVTEIGAGAFRNDKALKIIKIRSKKIKKIGNKAFAGIDKEAVFKVPSSAKAHYKKIISAGTGFRKTMKIR